MLVAPIKWYGTTRNRLPVPSRRWTEPRRQRAPGIGACLRGSPCSSSVSTAMKWLLPLPKLPCT